MEMVEKKLKRERQERELSFEEQKFGRNEFSSFKKERKPEGKEESVWARRNYRKGKERKKTK